MEKIASFTIDHIKLQPGVYVSRKDHLGEQVITTFDLRMTSPNEEPVMNRYYALVKVTKDNAGNKYHFITNRCGMETFDEAQLKAMLEVMDMGGVRKDEKGELVIHPAVETVATEDQNKPQSGSKGSKKNEGVV